MTPPVRGHPTRAALAADVVTFGGDPAAELAVVELLRTARDLEAVFAAELAPYGLSLSRFAILMELRTARNHQLSLTALGERLVVVPSNVTKQVDNLETRGLVTRVPSAVDRRVSFVRLTNEGAALLEHILPAHYAGQTRLMARLSASERALLPRLLGAVQRSAQERTAEGMRDRAERGSPADGHQVSAPAVHEASGVGDPS
jgi:MarR family 2-MHQ and catechol resistance regulon transcriptional repressor